MAEKKTFGKKEQASAKNRPHTQLTVRTNEMVIDEATGKEYPKTEYITGLWAYQGSKGPFLTGGSDEERFYINITDEVLEALGYNKKGK